MAVDRQRVGVDEIVGEQPFERGEVILLLRLKAFDLERLHRVGVTALRLRRQSRKHHQSRRDSEPSERTSHALPPKSA